MISFWVDLFAGGIALHVSKQEVAKYSGGIALHVSKQEVAKYIFLLKYSEKKKN